MSPVIDRELLAERSAAVGRHLDRVARHLPRDAAELLPETAAADTVILHLWQAVQVVIDLAVSTCVRLGLGSPPTYADAFRCLADAQVIPRELAERLARAAGFCNLVVHAYGRLSASSNRWGSKAPPNNGIPEPRTTGCSFTISSSISGRSDRASWAPPHSQMRNPCCCLSSLTFETGSSETSSTPGSGLEVMLRENT